MLSSGWQFADQTGQLGLSRPPTLLMTMMTLPKFGQKGGLRGQTWWIASLINDWSQLWGSLRTMEIILLGIKVLKVILHFYHVWSSGPVKQRLLSQQGWRLTINITIRENLLHWKIKRERGKNVSLGPPRRAAAAIVERKDWSPPSPCSCSSTPLLLLLMMMMVPLHSVSFSPSFSRCHSRRGRDTKVYKASQKALTSHDVS